MTRNELEALHAVALALEPLTDNSRHTVITGALDLLGDPEEKARKEEHQERLISMAIPLVVQIFERVMQSVVPPTPSKDIFEQMAEIMKKVEEAKAAADAAQAKPAAPDAGEVLYNAAESAIHEPPSAEPTDEPAA